MAKCMRCQHELIIEANFMESEFMELSEDDDAMITIAHCPHCGARYEIHDVSENSKVIYPYWQENII